jgi:PTH1 family peptidyl-tRNA hydrolase
MMKNLVVGLGNPGRKYAKSKHNVGFLCLDAYAKAKKLTFAKETKFLGEIAVIGQTILLKPKTFMNLSGNSVKAVRDFYQIETGNILVISDDIDLPLRKVRLREKGGSGGHNGLKSILAQLGSEEFKRCRIGIDRDPDVDPKEHVLADFSRKEIKDMDDVYATTNQIIDDFVNDTDFDLVMNRFN